ncbi:MAG: hypothetical protein HOP34_04050 [Methylococcaceae bacterium]|nr:hypothetical protein [Methylococcaceae bacterium]
MFNQWDRGLSWRVCGVGAWQQQRQLFADKEITEDDLPIAVFPLREFFGLNKSAWTVMASNPNCLRVLAAMLGAVDNLEAIRWSLEYRWIAAFLQGSDTLRQEQMKANPRIFVPRWGVENTVYNMAVYLDTNPDWRFKRVVAIPQIAPQFIVTQLPSPIEQVIQRAAIDIHPDKTLIAELEHLARQGYANSMAYAKMGLVLMGIEISEVPTQALIDACYRCMQGLRDAVFRAVSSQANYWFGLATTTDEAADSLAVSSLSDGKQAIIFNRVVNAAISALDATILMGNGGQNQLAVVCRANQWAARFSKQSDDFVYNFAVMLDTQGPADSGWVSALPLLSRILDNPNLRYVPTLEPVPYPAFWGIIPEEQLIPPDFYQALERLAWVANELHPDFGLGFAELFLKHISAMGEIGQQKNQLLFLLGFDFPNREIGLQLQQELHLFMKTLKSRYQGIGLSEENHWDLIRNNSKTNDAIMQLELGLAECRISISEKTASYFDALVERLAEKSQFDACLLLVRSAQYAPLDIAQIWLKQALSKLAHYPDDYAQAEFLARFRQLPDDLIDVALEQQHKVLVRQLKSRSPLLATHALGRVGQYLCQSAFPWNAPDVLGTDPAWVVVASYAAMADIVTVKSAQQDLSGLWQNLAENPDLSVIEDILSRSGVNGLECTVAAIKAINTLKSRSDLHVARLLTLLTRPSSAVMPLLNNWLTQEDGGVYTQHLKAVAALLLAERNKVLTPELLEPLFWLREYGDDMAATRAEIILASPYRKAEREQRRFSLTKNGVDIAKRLAELSLVYQNDANKRHLYRCAGLALNDWRFDDAEALQHWCDKAVADSHEEATLLQITDWVDLWTADCQQVLCAWLLSGSGLSANRRHKALVKWVARLYYIKNAELDANALASLSLIPENDPIRQLHCFVQADNKHGEYESILTVLGRLAAVFYSDVHSYVQEAEQEFKATQMPLFPEGKQSAPDTEILKMLGNISYSWLGEFPEDCLPLVFAKLYEPQFTYALMSWLHTVIVHAPFSSNDNTAESLVQERKLEALLSFAVCFSERNPSTYINYIDRLDVQPHQFQVALARLMYLRTSLRSQMAIVTLISRLKRVDLQLVFEVNGENYTVLDALLYGLHGDVAVQQRVAEVLPKIKSLEGGQVLDKLRQLMIGEQANSTRGSVVLAAAQLLQGLAQSNALSTAERRETDLLLRTAASHAQNCRPLYRQIGTGNDSDPVGVLYMGDLAEELATLAMRNRF